MDSNEISRDKLASDLRVVIADAEELLRATANQAGEKVAAARLRIQDSMDAARVRLSELSSAGVEQAKAAARATDEFVHTNPWKSVGIGAGIGLILGLLISRR
jgi:ElaB/YqjD/DUF883 family membrane-anchored ribosome-binding protein